MINDFSSQAFADAIKPATTQRGPDLRWAEKIVAKHKAGQHVNHLSLKWASEALAKHRKQPDDVINVEVNEVSGSPTK